VVKKGAGLFRLQRLPHRKPRDLRSVGRAAGAIPRSSRTYEATQAPWQHGSRRPSRGTGNAGGLGRRRRGGPGLQTGGLPGRRRHRVLEHTHRGGEHGISGSAPSARPVPCPSLGVARPMLLGEAIPRAPSLHRGGRHQAHRPRLERGDAPARGTRRGSTEGMAPWRHLTTGVKPGRARPGRRRSPSSHQTGRTRKGWRHP